MIAVAIVEDQESNEDFIDESFDDVAADAYL